MGPENFAKYFNFCFNSSFQMFEKCTLHYWYVYPVWPMMDRSMIKFFHLRRYARCRVGYGGGGGVVVLRATLPETRTSTM